MRAPVYRSLEGRNTVAGLAFPTEFVVVLSVWWLGMLTIGAGTGVLGAFAAYVGIRMVNYGRAEGFVQSWLQYQGRQLLAAGRLSAAARVPARRALRFPYGGYAFEGDDLAARLSALYRPRGEG